LALVSQVVNRYGGSVEVTNDAGAVFTVRLPHTVRTSGTRA
jgi:signal transduction histidine kinase